MSSEYKDFKLPIFDSILTVRDISLCSYNNNETNFWLKNGSTSTDSNWNNSLALE